VILDQVAAEVVAQIQGAGEHDRDDEHVEQEPDPDRRVVMKPRSSGPAAAVIAAAAPRPGHRRSLAARRGSCRGRRDCMAGCEGPRPRSTSPRPRQLLDAGTITPAEDNQLKAKALP
jgi:hypothetical protein